MDVTKPAADADTPLGFKAEDEFAPEFTAEPAAGWTEDAPEPAAADIPDLNLAAYDDFDDITEEAPRQILEEPDLAPSPTENLRASIPAGPVEASVPRITVHFFCERSETIEAVEGAIRDRRMEKATTQILPGGLAAALGHYQQQPTPSLIVLESCDPAPILLRLLDQLAEVCDPGTKVVVIGQSNDIALYRELIARGVSEYVVPPIQPLDIIKAVTNLYSDPNAPFVGRSIAFVGARGGAGASTIAHNFAYSLTENLQTNAVIVDFDLPFGTAGLDFNQDPLQGIADALSQPDRLDSTLLDRMMARCSERLSLFAAPASLDQDYDISGEAFEEVASKIRQTAPFVILDLPHIWSGWMRKILLSGDEVVIVATPDLSSLRNAKNMMDLIRQERPNDDPPRLVLNQVGVPGRPEIPLKDFSNALGVEPSMILPYDGKLFGGAANNGQMVLEIGPKSKSAELINQFTQTVTRREAPKATKKSLFSNLIKAK